MVADVTISLRSLRRVRGKKKGVWVPTAESSNRRASRICGGVLPWPWRSRWANSIQSSFTLSVHALFLRPEVLINPKILEKTPCTSPNKVLNRYLPCIIYRSIIPLMSTTSLIHPELKSKPKTSLLWPKKQKKRLLRTLICVPFFQTAWVLFSPFPRTGSQDSQLSTTNSTSKWKLHSLILWRPTYLDPRSTCRLFFQKCPVQRKLFWKPIRSLW